MTFKPFTHVSPSQLETFIDTGSSGCNRKWWFSKILGLPIPQSGSAALGSAVHAGQEKFIETGDPADVHPLAKGTLPLLEAFRANAAKAPGKLLIEHALSRQLRNGLMMVGRIDLLDLTAGQDAWPLVHDWKTTSSPAYAKTPEELKSNIQGLVYANEAVILDIQKNGLPSDPKAPRGVTFSHGYIPTKGGVPPFVRKVDIPLDDIHSGWRRIVDITDTMIEVSKFQSPSAVRPNKAACKAFGGCSFRERCDALASAVSVTVNPTNAPTNAQTNEKTMPTEFSPTAPYSAMLAAFGSDAAIKASMPQVSDEQLLAWKEGRIGPAATQPARQAATVTPQRGVNPPESKAATNAPVVEQAPAASTAASAEEKAELLASLGWEDDDLSSLTDEDFEEAVRLNLRFEDAEYDKVENEESPTGYDYTNVRRIKKTKAEPEAAPEPAPKRRRGRRPGSKTEPVVEQTLVQPPKFADGSTVYCGPYTYTILSSEYDTSSGDGEWSYLCNVGDGGARVRSLESSLTSEPPTPTVEPDPTPAVDTVGVDVAQAPSTAAVETPTITIPLQIPEQMSVPTEQPFVLYIDCVPEPTNAHIPLYRMLDNVIEPLMKLAAENYKDEKTNKPAPLPHYGLIPFGKGPATVAAYVLENLPEIAQGSVVVDSRSPCAAAVVEVLRPLAVAVVRGVR